jgi:hypothetical protein
MTHRPRRTSPAEQAALPVPMQRVNAAIDATSLGIDRAVHRLANLVKFEVVVALVCATIPLWMWVGDGGYARESISAHYSMQAAKYFYIPLTTGGMLFIVNGVVKDDRHWYNLWLGVALLALTFFDHQSQPIIHFAAAGAFFIGNALVFVRFSPKKERWFKWLLVGLMAAALSATFVWHVISLFWAESISLWLIALHFVGEAMGWIE